MCRYLACNSCRAGTPGIQQYIYHRMQDHPVEVEQGLALGLRRSNGSNKPAFDVWRDANDPSRLACGFEAGDKIVLSRYSVAGRGHWASSRPAPGGSTLEGSGSSSETMAVVERCSTSAKLVHTI
ncbi:MAG: DUF5722 domain-containing protein [Polyangiales bacterium]